MRPPVTDQETLDLLTWVKAKWQPTFTKFDEDSTYYEGDFVDKVELPEGYNVTIPSTLRAVVDEAVDNIMPQDFKVLYSPRKMNKKAEEDADKIRMYCRALIFHWLRNGTDVNPIREAAKNLFVSGYGGVKFVFDETLWPSYSDEGLEKAKKSGKLEIMNRRIKEARSRNCPFVLKALPPRCVVVDTTVGGRKLWAVELYETTVDEITRTYAKYDKDLASIKFYRSRKPSIAEVWTADHIDHNGEWQLGQHWVIINDKVLLVEENEYGEIPYNFKFSGFGREDYNGDPATKAVGFYTPQVKSLGEAEVRSFAQSDAIVSQWAWPVVTVPDTYDPDDLDLTPGKVNSIPEDLFANNERMFIRVPIPDSPRLQNLQWVGAQIERPTTQAVLRGTAIPGTDSAAQLSGYYGSAKLRLSSAQEALEDILSWACSMALRMIEEELEEETSVWIAEDTVKQYGVGPKNIQGHHVVTVRFQLSEEQQKERRLALASDALSKGGFSYYDAMVYAGYDNPGEMFARKLAYDAMQQPLIAEGLALRQAQEWGLDVAGAKTAAAQNQVENAKIAQLIAMAQQPPPQPSQQQPEAALAQQGMGPMPMDQGGQVMDPNLMNGAQAQALAGSMV